MEKLIKFDPVITSYTPAVIYNVKLHKLEKFVVSILLKISENEP